MGVFFLGLAVAYWRQILIVLVVAWIANATMHFVDIGPTTLLTGAAPLDRVNVQIVGFEPREHGEYMLADVTNNSETHAVQNLYFWCPNGVEVSHSVQDVGPSEHKVVKLAMDMTAPVTGCVPHFDFVTTRWFALDHGPVANTPRYDVSLKQTVSEHQSALAVRFTNRDPVHAVKNLWFRCDGGKTEKYDAGINPGETVEHTFLFVDLGNKPIGACVAKFGREDLT